MKGEIINIVKSEMLNYLNAQQMERLDKVLEHVLWEVTIVKEDKKPIQAILSNTELVNNFLDAKNLEGCSAKTNRKAGYLIGQGLTMQEAMDEVHMVVEGVYSTKAAYELGKKYGVDLPIINEVYSVLFENKNAAESVKELMLRNNKTEYFAREWN